ncbi:nucleotidyl transferase AbiEii/AbiGii toxin family protein [Burkholderia sp. BCC1630]|uniref:nucleotidyl transferase AbiEii/AbiGii toxin family protein n=1 Tax=Burkholderia sp. BCC1630 TaxID=2676304 RepID=UPI00158D279E|nr:nucleotidyl transferase AbiEii/AbiGii toxin family protein [Burkholderia sp. BCC1630]
MKTITDNQRDLIDELLAEQTLGDISAAILEKDIHVTDALRSLTTIEHEHVRLVFCGGTSLSKAHGLIERMSEDIDLKIILAPEHGLSQNQLKNHFSSLKSKVATVLEGLGFEEIKDMAIARNSNRYFGSSWRYASVYPTHHSLRTHLSVEFTVRTPYFDISDEPLDYLVYRLVGQDSAPFTMCCVSVEETLAEKVISFMRRFAEHRARVRDDWDEALVRHIYDTWRIVSVDKDAVERATTHFADLVEFDRAEFAKHAAFAADPAKYMKDALAEIEHDRQTQDEYANKLIPLIYGADRPVFKDAFAVFKATAERLLATL